MHTTRQIREVQLFLALSLLFLPSLAAWAAPLPGCLGIAMPGFEVVSTSSIAGETIHVAEKTRNGWSLNVYAASESGEVPFSQLATSLFSTLRSRHGIFFGKETVDAVDAMATIHFHKSPVADASNMNYIFSRFGGSLTFTAVPKNAPMAVFEVARGSRPVKTEAFASVKYSEFSKWFSEGRWQTVVVAELREPDGPHSREALGRLQLELLERMVEGEAGTLTRNATDQLRALPHGESLSIGLGESIFAVRKSSDGLKIEFSLIQPTMRAIKQSRVLDEVHQWLSF